MNIKFDFEKLISGKIKVSVETYNDFRGLTRKIFTNGERDFQKSITIGKKTFIPYTEDFFSIVCEDSVEAESLAKNWLVLLEAIAKEFDLIVVPNEYEVEI